MLVNLGVAILLVGSVAMAVGSLREAVARRAAAGRPAVVLVNRPAWMTDLVADQLAEKFRPDAVPSVFDRQALVEVNQRMSANPWVSKVKSVRRVFGGQAGDTIEVDCDFRAPLALVREGDADAYWFVDGKGVLLPERFTKSELPKVMLAPDGRINVRVIEGVRNAPPPGPGKLWAGDDLLAGLDLAARLNGLAFTEEIVRLDVSNYNGRSDPRKPHVVLVTKYNTQVWWGRPWIASDAFIEVPPERKLSVMRDLVAHKGRVDAGYTWVDLRYDEPARPKDGRVVEPDRRTAEASTRGAGDGR
jgi:hypothetical protein